MYLPLVSKMVTHSHLNPGGGRGGGGVKGAAKEAIDQHPSKPLISLVPITFTTYCFQDGSIVKPPSLLFSQPITNLGRGELPRPSNPNTV